MADVAIGPAAGPEPAPGGGASSIEWASGGAAAGRHPWVLEVRPGSPPVSPNLLAWTDAGMRITLRSGLAEQPAASALLLVDGYVRSHLCSGSSSPTPTRRGLWADQLRQLVTPESTAWPGPGAGLARRLRRRRGPGRVPWPDFEFGLAVLLDGIEALAAR